MTQTSLIPCLRFSAHDGCLHAILSLIIVHRFSIGLRSGLCRGQSSTEVSFFFRNAVATFDRWHGAPSCTNIVQRWMCMRSFNVSLSNTTYLGSFIVVLGRMKLDQQRHGMTWNPKSFGSAGVSLWLHHIFCQNYSPMAAYCVCDEVQTAEFRQKTTLFLLGYSPMAKDQSVSFFSLFFSFFSSLVSVVLNHMFDAI